MNGSEIISASDDRTFESTVGNWVGVGACTIVRSTVAYHSGSASGLIAGVGNGTSNYAKLPSANLGTIVAGLKYTLEIWNQDITTATKLNITIGSQTFQSGTEATGAFGKVVFNFLATASEVGADLRVWMTTSTGGYIDDVSLSPSYDIFSICIAKHSLNTLSGNQFLFRIGNATTSGNYALLANSAQNWQLNITDATSTTNSSSSAKSLSDNQWHLICSTFARTGNANLYFDGSQTGTPGNLTNIGKIVVSSGQLSIGCSSSPGFFWDGSIGETQVYIFQSGLPSNIAQIISQINSTWKTNGLPRSINGVLPAFWNNPARGLVDLSGNGNNLTNNNGANLQIFYP